MVKGNNSSGGGKNPVQKGAAAIRKGANVATGGGKGSGNTGKQK